MSQYRPAIEDLIRTIADLINAIAPRHSGEERYKLQVASYLLGICQRELTIGSDHRDLDFAAWDRLLGGGNHRNEALTSKLCSEIRAGRFDVRFDELVETVLARTAADVRVVRPDHLNREPGPQ